ncbi:MULTISPECIES: cold-shock protein [unclassified Streptomyces]|uniref:cold-shock protein n=1 Tax=unclassified Streptomyces TaxID=2593676 RepID=UPI00131639B9|nr:cold shock domain-containing protein [Streptomyces sp. GS7]QHC22811.1 cold shock domain-containing protein [Streptomyces sp. GS7]
MSVRVSGTVRWFNQAMGYGYTTGDDGREARVRSEDLEDGTFLTEGLRVTYVVVGEDEDDLRAERVRIVG